MPEGRKIYIGIRRRPTYFMVLHEKYSLLYFILSRNRGNKVYYGFDGIYISVLYGGSGSATLLPGIYGLRLLIFFGVLFIIECTSLSSKPIGDAVKGDRKMYFAEFNVARMCKM